jgi:hypothetical protein
MACTGAPVVTAASSAADDACPVAIPAPSQCGNDAAWVRGVATFDPSHYAPGAKPVLRVALRHSFIVVRGEDAIGGRLHAFASFPVDDPSSGKVSFSIDMCMFETSMWSEENGTFHLVLILDEDGNNDILQAGSEQEAIALAVPGTNELTKMVDLDISCHGTAACLDVNVDCTGGTSCTKITPIRQCTKKTPGCDSAAAFCQ